MFLQPAESSAPATQLSDLNDEPLLIPACPLTGDTEQVRPNHRDHLVSPDVPRLLDGEPRVDGRKGGERQVLLGLGIEEVLGECDPDSPEGSVVGGGRRHAATLRRIDWVYNQSMARPSVRERRRAEITRAFAKVLAEHGHEGATIAAAAAAAGVAPGLVHHHFASKADLVDSLLTELVARFRERTRAKEAGGDPLAAYLSAAVEIDASADFVAARCWVGILAEAVRSPALGARVRTLADREIEAIQRRSGDALSVKEAGAVLAFVVGALVLGAFAPQRTAGFAAAAVRRVTRR